MSVHLLCPQEADPGGLTQARQTLLPCLPAASAQAARVVVAVGWHTAAERLLRQVGPGQRRVMWSHGLGSLVFYRSRPLAALVRWLSRLPQLLQVVATLRHCDALVVAYPRRSWWDPRSVDVALAHRFGVPVAVIGNPIDTQFWCPGPSRAQDSTVLSIGRLEWQKGHEGALRIVAQLHGATKLCVLAPASARYEQQLRQLAAHEKASDRLLFRFGLTAEQRRQELQQALCLLSWSETEYQSLAMLEALACGCPVVARPRGWLCHGTVPGVLVVQSRREAARVIQALQQQPRWRERLAAAGRAYVCQQHGLPAVALQWRRVLADLA